MTWLRRIALAVAGLLLATYVGSIGYAYWPHEERPAAELALEQDLFAEVDGHRLRYRRWGDHPGKPTVLFLHGFAGTLNAFSRVAPLLGEDMNVLAVDLMPFGLSAKPVDHDYRFPNQARTIAKLAKKLGVGELIIAGHSYGGTVAAYMAANEPMVSKLVLIDPGIQATGVPSFVEHMIFPFRRMGARMFTGRGFRKKFVVKSFEARELITDEFVDELVLGTHMDGYMDGTTAFFSQYMDVEVEWLFDNIKVPTLLIWGKQDKNNPPKFGEEMDAALADSRLVVIDRSGHYPHMEQPEAVRAAIREFAQPPAAAAAEATAPVAAGQPEPEPPVTLIKDAPHVDDSKP